MPDVSLFEVDENGEIVYDSPESEVVENGVDPLPSDPVGNLVETEETLPETDLEIEENPSSVYLLESGDSGSAVVYSEELSAIAASVTPAGGSIGSSTLDYFDRIASGLPADYKYIAYRSSSDDSYDGVMYYSDDYDVSDSTISFRSCKMIEVVRESSSGYNTVTNYYVSDQTDVDVSYSLGSSVIYYTNAEIGYPVLGGYAQPVSVSPFLVAAVLCSVLTTVLSRIILRR